MRHRRGGNRVYRRTAAAAREADIVIKFDRTIRSEAAALAVRGSIVIGVGLDARRTRDPQRRGSAAEKHIHERRARHRAREREEITAAVIAGIEAGMVERPGTVLCLDLHKGVVASGYVAQRDGAVFEVSTTQEYNGRGSRVWARTL